MSIRKFAHKENKELFVEIDDSMAMAETQINSILQFTDADGNKLYEEVTDKKAK